MRQPIIFDCRDWKAGRSTPGCRDRIHYVFCITTGRPGPCKLRTGHTGQCMSMHRAYWPYWPYTVYIAVSYTQGRGRQTVPNVNEKHAPSPIGCHSKHAWAVELLNLLIQYNDPVDYERENGQ